MEIEIMIYILLILRYNNGKNKTQKVNHHNKDQDQNVYRWKMSKIKWSLYFLVAI